MDEGDGHVLGMMGFWSFGVLEFFFFGGLGDCWLDGDAESYS